jgi:hypothetical protein
MKTVPCTVIAPRRVLTAVFLALVWPAVMGMGGKPGTEIPVPDIDFSATVADDQDITTRCTKVSWEGETYFKAMRGKGVITISFEKVKKVVRVGSAGEGKTDFQVTLRDGQVVAVSLYSDERFFGTTSFGSYRITARNIKEIVFE